jgi:hypothetical protein
VYNGLDLIDFFRVEEVRPGVRARRHSWRKLDNLLRQLRLSDASALVEAQAQDPEHAAWLLKQPPGPDRGPAVSDFTPDHAMLVEIRDGLAELIAVTVAVAPGNKYRAPTPSKRPSTALTRARAAASKARHLSLVDEVKAAQERWEATHGTSE